MQLRAEQQHLTVPEWNNIACRVAVAALLTFRAARKSKEHSAVEARQLVLYRSVAKQDIRPALPFSSVIAGVIAEAGPWASNGTLSTRSRRRS